MLQPAPCASIRYVPVSQKKLPSDPRALLDVMRSGVTQVDPDLDVDNLQVAIVASRFNAAIVDRLVQGAVTTLIARGLPAEAIAVMRVPGAWEIPALVQRLARSSAFDGVIALGCVIRGETAHFELIANEATRALMDLGLQNDVPITNGLLACENEAQALARAGGEHGNKGSEAADALLDLIGVIEAAETSFDMLADDMDADFDVGEMMDAMEEMRAALEESDRKKKRK